MKTYRNVYETPKLFFHHAIDEKPCHTDYKMHIHIHYEIYFFVSGNVTYLVENNEYQLKPGNILLIRPMEYHMAKITGDEKYERYCVIFSDEMLDFIDPERKLLACFNSGVKGKANIFSPADFNGTDPAELFKSMNISDVRPEMKRTAVLSNLYALLWELTRAQESREVEKDKSENSLTDRILRYMNRHLFDDISIKQISEHFYISPSYLHRLIKNAVGTTAWNYILFKRLSAAQGEIRNGSTAVAACRKCGFKDYSAFYRAYIKRYGVSPASDGASSAPDIK